VDRLDGTRFWLRGTIFTDGLVIYRLAYDASVVKTRRQQQQQLGDQDDDELEADDALELLDSVEGHEDFDNMDSEDLAAALRDSAFGVGPGLLCDDKDADLPLATSDEPSTSTLGTNSTSHINNTGPLPRSHQQEPGSSSTLDPAPQPSSDRLQSRATPDPAWTRWTAGTRLLPNVELRFSSPDKCPDPTEALVIGWDPGAKYAAVTSCLNPQDPHRRHTLTISRGFLWRPALLFRDLVDKKKKDTLGPDGLRTIKDLEAAIPSYSLDNLPAYIRYMSAPHGTSPPILETLMDFYRQTWYRRNRWDSKKAQVASMDYAVESILNMASRTITTQDSSGVERVETIKASTWGIDKRLPPIIVCIGLAQFNVKTGLPSKHAPLIKRFVQKVKNWPVRWKSSEEWICVNIPSLFLISFCSFPYNH
jgi:hypothetical protein